MKNRFVVASAAVVFAAAGMAQAQSFTEAFDDVASLTATGGWYTQNNSSPLGVIGYFQGNTAVFLPHATAGYLGVNFNSTTGTGTISNWFVTPVLSLQNGQTFSFYTRTEPATIWPDRLQVRMSLAGASTNVGTVATDVGDFTTLLLDINETLSPTGYPLDWTQFTVTISGAAVPTNGRLAFRYYVDEGGPAGANSDYIGIDTVEYLGTPQPTGACCLPSGNCTTTTNNACVSQGGLYGGDGSPCATANCPLPGACCLPNGTCAIMLAATCTASNGIFRGEGSTCATANCPMPPGMWIEQDDAGNLPGTAQTTNGTGSLNTVNGALTAGDVDMYKITVCDSGTFTATISGTISDTQLFLFDSTGKGVAMNDDDPAGSGLQSALSPAGSISGLTNGTYYIAISSYDNDPNDSAALALWLDTPFNTVRAPDGPGAANPVAAWDNNGSNAGTYSIALTGACYGGSTAASCYANCDNSTNAPCLNVNDFVCFNNAFSAGSAYANCDASTISPVLNVNDFVCFNNKFSAGCASPCAPHP